MEGKYDPESQTPTETQIDHESKSETETPTKTNEATSTDPIMEEINETSIDVANDISQAPATVTTITTTPPAATATATTTTTSSIAFTRSRARNLANFAECLARLDGLAITLSSEFPLPSLYLASRGVTSSSVPSLCVGSLDTATREFRRVDKNSELAIETSEKKRLTSTPWTLLEQHCHHAMLTRNPHIDEKDHQYKPLPIKAATITICHIPHLITRYQQAQETMTTEKLQFVERVMFHGTTDEARKAICREEFMQHSTKHSGFCFSGPHKAVEKQDVFNLYNPFSRQVLVIDDDENGIIVNPNCALPVAIIHY